MSKRVICDLAFALVIFISVAHYFEGHNFNYGNGFEMTCITIILLSLLIYIIGNLISIRMNFCLTLCIVMSIVLSSYTYLGYKEYIIDNYFKKNVTVDGTLYYDDPINKSNANLLIKLNSPIGFKIAYKARIYDNNGLLKDIDDGELIKVKVSNLKIKEKSNYGEFDYKNYLRGSGVSSPLIVSKLLETSRIYDKSFYFYRKIFLRKTYDLIQNIVDDKDNANFIYALVSGAKSGLEKDIIKMFTITSTVHLLTVSGFHFALIYSLIERTLWFLKIPRNLKLLSLMFIMIFYYLMTPMKFSCLRALIMILILIISKLLNRQFDFMCALSFVVIGSLLLNPYVIYDLSFVLTYLACIGIGIIYKQFSKIEEHIHFAPNLIKKTASIFMLSISIQVSLALYFIIDSVGINLLSAVINIPLSFMISILMMLIFPYITIYKLGILSFLSDKLNIPNLASEIVNIILAFVRYSANLDIFICKITSHKYLFIVLILTFIVSLYIKQNVKSLKEINIGLLLSILLIIFIIPSHILSNNNALQIIFNDVGQGDCSMIITEKGSVIMIDLGDGKIDVSKLMASYNVDKLDILIYSHGHSDHTGGEKEWSQEIQADIIFAPLHMKEILENKSSEVHFIDKRLVLDVDSIKLDILPIRLDEENLNNDGILVKLTSNELDVLFTGDIESDCEELLIGSDMLESIDILKVPHHGSKTSSTEAFVANVSPVYAIVPVGENKYGHPNKEVINRYSKVESKVIILREYGQTSFTYKDDKLKMKSYFKIDK